MTGEAGNRSERPGAAAPGETYVAVGYLAFLIFAWGGNYTWVKIAMRDIGPLWFNFIRYGLSTTELALDYMQLGRARQLVPESG